MHIVRYQRSYFQRIIIKIIAIILALLVSGLLIIIITHLNPFEVFITVFNGTFASKRRLFGVLRDTGFLFLISLGLAPAFKMNYMNNGGEGQILAGALAAGAVMINFANQNIPNILLIIIMAIASLIVSGIWGLIPALFKIKYQTNETLFTLMMNYIMIQIVEFAVDLWDKKQSHVVGIINPDNNRGWLKPLMGNQYTWVFIIVIAVAVFIYIYLNYTKSGYEIDVVGESLNTAAYAGIDINKVTIKTVLLSSMICGLAGFINVSGISHSISANTASGKGFTAIIVAWLSKFNVLSMALVSFMLQFLAKGAMQIASDFNLNDYIADVIIALILFFIIASEFFCNYRLKRRDK